MKNTSLVQHSDLLELVFAGRNRTYGAYLLRRNYPKHLARALGLGFWLIISFLGFVHLVTAVENKEQAKDTEIVFCGGDIPHSLTEAPPPPKPPQMATQPRAPRSSIRFVPPIVLQDEAVPDQPVHTQHELANTPLEIGGKNHTGNPDAPPGLPNLEILNTEGGTGALENPVSEEVYEGADVQKMPAFPGGEGELLRYLAREIRYPELAREAQIEGQVVLSFVVQKNGAIENVQVLKDPGGGCAREAVRVLSSMPRWMPGEANGHPVKVRFYLPVRFEFE